MTVCLSLPTEQLLDAHAAVDRWDMVLHNWVRMVPIDQPKDDSHCNITVRLTETPARRSSGEEIDNALAWCACVGCRDIYMRKGRYEQDVTGILEHEIGHALGAQHADGTLMNPTWAPHQYQCPDRTTVLQVAAWNHIDADLLTWCWF